MPTVFITSTFRNDWNRDFNLKIDSVLQAEGIKVFLPQRDSDQSTERKRIFEDDVQGIDQSDLIVAIGSKTQTANWGFEIGYMFKTGKPVIILTDKEHPIELMPEAAATEIIVVDNLDDFDSFRDELIRAVKAHLADPNSPPTT